MTGRSMPGGLEDERSLLEGWLRSTRHLGHADLLRERIDGATGE
jgi:Protein of unknown function (DUF664)